MPRIAPIFTNYFGTNYLISNKACPSPSEKPTRLSHSGGGWDEAFATDYTDFHGFFCHNLHELRSKQFHSKPTNNRDFYLPNKQSSNITIQQFFTPPLSSNNNSSFLFVLINICRSKADQYLFFHQQNSLFLY